MESRAILRNLNSQRALEKHGAIRIPFLLPENISWVYSIIGKVIYVPPLITKEEYETIFNRFLSKVEYICINCSPVYLTFIQNLQLTGVQKEISITDEYQHPSLHILIPLMDGNESADVKFLENGHHIVSHPRGQGLHDIYSGFDEEISGRMRKITLKQGEAVFLYSHIPYFLDSAPELIWLKIAVLPYEFKSLFFKMDVDTISQYLMTEDDWYQYYHCAGAFSPRRYRRFEHARVRQTLLDSHSFKKKRVSFVFRIFGNK